MSDRDDEIVRKAVDAAADEWRASMSDRKARDAGIREAIRLAREDWTFRRLQDEQRPWVAHNFAGRHPYYPLLGAMEELGELSHAHLKALQGIRTNEDHEAAKKDAIGDIVIYLADYCSANGIDFQEAVEVTWASVKQRDWKKNTVNGDASLAATDHVSDAGKMVAAPEPEEPATGETREEFPDADGYENPPIRCGFGDRPPEQPQSDPDGVLPTDVKVGSVTFRAGVAVKTLQGRIDRLVAQLKRSSAPAAPEEATDDNTEPRKEM